MAVVHRRHGAARIARAIHDGPQTGGHECAPLVAPTCSREIAGHHQQTGSRDDRFAQTRANRSVRRRNLVEDDERPRREILGSQRILRSHVDVEGGPVADRQRAAQVEALVRARLRRQHDQHRHRLAGREREVECVVRWERIASDAHRAPRGRRGDHVRRETRLRHSFGRHRELLRLDRAPAELQRRIDGACRRAGVGNASRDGHAVAISDAVAIGRSLRHREIGALRAADVHGPHGRTRRKPHIVAPSPCDALEIADQHDFLPRQVRRREDLCRELQRGFVPCSLRAELRAGDRSLETRLTGGRLGGRHGIVREEHDRGAIVAGEISRLHARGIERALPVVRIPHAVRAVHEHHALARAEQRRLRGAPALEKRARERGHEQCEREAAHREQQQVPQLLPPDRPVRNLAQEHQRRELHDRPPLAVDQVDRDRDPDREQAGEERGSEESHQRAVLKRSRASR